MSQVTSWSAIKYMGDWCLEERTTSNGKSHGTWLCVMDAYQREQSFEVPHDLLHMLVSAGAQVRVSTGWDGGKKEEQS